MRLDSLTSLRGLASLAVVMFHALVLFRLPNHPDTIYQPIDLADPLLCLQLTLLAIFNGQAAVVLFFVLSGCVLAMALDRSAGLDRQSLWAFYVRRSFRIYPLLWVAVLFGAAAVPTILAGRSPALVSTWGQVAYDQSLTLKQIVRGAIGIDDRLNQPIWSLAIEIVYSLLFPAIWLSTRTLLLAAFTTLLAVLLLLAPIHFWSRLDLYLLAFVLGAIVARLPGPRTRPGLAQRLGWWLVVVGSVLALLLARRMLDPRGLAMELPILVESVAAAALIHVLIRRRVPTSGLERPWLIGLGEISYGIYALHFPVLFLLATLAIGTLPAELIAARPIAANLALGLATLALTIPLARFCHRWIERPCIRLGHRFARSTGPRPALPFDASSSPVRPLTGG